MPMITARFLAKHAPELFADPVDITGCFDILVGEGENQITIQVNDSWLTVRSRNEAPTIIRPVSANSVRIKL